ncbi:MAG: putative glycoside hydrolase [Candidatus Nealsonbacteria bacterium]
MQKQARTLIVVAIVILSALLAGGFFIYNRKQITNVAIDQDVTSGATSTIEEIPIATEDSSNFQNIALELARVAKESQELAVQTQEFLAQEKEKSLVKEKSAQVKGIYINEFLANSQTSFAKTYRENIKRMLRETELNGVVIDIKENMGPNLSDSLKTFINELHQKNIWVIARICVFRDSSLREEKPEWYLKDSLTTSSDNIWRDASDASWLDASSTEAQAYLIDFSKKAIDFGFDELQFDYVRFPSDGELNNIVYPFYDAEQEKYEIMGNFFFKLARDLKEYKPSIILSADLFGYLATQYQSSDIGQRLFDAGTYFDYVSFMLYPSHFYGGFSADYDASRALPALNFPYEAQDIATVASNNPYPVILRSVLSGIDYLERYGLGAKVRPWLQDFNLNRDVSRGIIYDAEKIKAQIQGAQDGGSSGWLLWNSAGIYTQDAFLKVGE